MRFPESLIQLKASGALKGAFSLPWFYLLFPLTECRRGFMHQQEDISFNFRGQELPGRSSAFCWFRISFFGHMNTSSKHKSVQVDQKDDCLVMHLNCQDRSAFISPREWIGAADKIRLDFNINSAIQLPGCSKLANFRLTWR